MTSVGIEQYGICRAPAITKISITEFANRLEELKAMKSGWLDGEGEALSREGMDWLGIFFENAPEGTLLPCLYPMPEGGVQAEWPDDVSMEIDLARHIGVLYCSTGEIDEYRLNLDNPDDQKILFQKLSEIQGMT